MIQLNSSILMIVFAVPALAVAAVLASETQTNTETPSELGNPSLAAMGFVDVTADPFSADPRGKRDSTAALQRAIVFARDHQMVCFFQPGEYKVSGTLNCEQYRPLRRDGRRQGKRDYPCVLLGSRRAEKRPRIVLAPHSAGYSNPENHALFIVERTPNFLLANLVDSPRMPQGIPDTYFAGDGVDPRRWHMVRESTAVGETILTPPLDRPVLYKFDLASFPVVILGASSKLDPVQLRRIIDDQIKYRLERLPGVAAVDVWGGLAREIHVDLDADRVKALGLPVNLILDRIRSANITLPGGQIDRGNYEVMVRTGNDVIGIAHHERDMNR